MRLFHLAAGLVHRRKRSLIRGLAAVAGLAAGFVAAWHVWPFPIERLESWPASPVVTDRTGRVLLSVVGTDEQWRFPVEVQQISPWVVRATIAAEDERFERHPGVDPWAVLRAMGQNVRAGRTVSGASTITMQVCRMMDDRSRTWRAKTIEAFRALQLERLRSKSEILQIYLNLAPYGRNLRGIEAAAQAYFGKRAADLSLGEASLLAGLPQSPSRYRPDRSMPAALARREYVLARMRQLGMITPEQADLAGAHCPELTSRWRRDRSPHVAWLALQRRPGGGRTTIDAGLQADVARLVDGHLASLPARTQAAVVVLDIAQSEIVALVGSADAADPISGGVNGALARRSPGSTLKPFIYAAAFEAGRIGPDSTVYDIPITRAGWSPANFDETFSGQVTAAEALRRSLNIPAILVAEEVGLPRCLGVIEAAGIRLPARAQSRGGLAVVTGAVEVSLLDLVNGYATLGRGGIRSRPRLFLDESAESSRVLDADVCAALDEILSCRRRQPAGRLEGGDELAWFMWKTGTSSGRRDAWAVGHNRRYAIGVWIGRFSGEGSPDYVGGLVAEPLLAALFEHAGVRTAEDPPPPRGLAVRSPLAPPRELEGGLQILSPAPDAEMVTVGDTAVVRPVASRSDRVMWFLDGKLVSPEETGVIAVEVGHHELRCIDFTGASASRFFRVSVPETHRPAGRARAAEVAQGPGTR